MPGPNYKTLVHNHKLTKYKELETAQRGTPEYTIWMNLYIDQENEIIQYIVEDDNVTYTFYTARDEK